MSTHNIGFRGEIRKYLPNTPSYMELYCVDAFSQLPIMSFFHTIKLQLLKLSQKTTQRSPGPSCSKLTMSLVNDSLKF